MVLMLPKKPRQGSQFAAIAVVDIASCYLRGILEVRLWPNVSKAVRNGEVKLLMLV